MLLLAPSPASFLHHPTSSPPHGESLPCSIPPQPEQPTACLAEGITADGYEHDVLQPDPSQPCLYPAMSKGFVESCPFPGCSEANRICSLNWAACPRPTPHPSFTLAPSFGAAASLLCPSPWRVCWIRGTMRAVGPSPNPSDSLHVPVNWEDKPLWGYPTMAQLHPSLLPPGSIMGTFNQAILTLGAAEILQILCQSFRKMLFPLHLVLSVPGVHTARFDPALLWMHRLDLLQGACCRG